jgi:hypothetical protein
MTSWKLLSFFLDDSSFTIFSSDFMTIPLIVTEKSLYQYCKRYFCNNNFLTYVNVINKITMRYPSTWTKTEFTGNHSIPVMFNAPITSATTKATAKTNFVISITRGAANLDSYTQQQINGLTHSKAVKYTITDTWIKAGVNSSHATRRLTTDQGTMIAGYVYRYNRYR